MSNVSAILAFFGDGHTVCEPCGPNMDSPRGSTSSANCSCVDFYQPKSDGEGCEPVCSTEEAAQYATSGVDAGILSTSNCEFGAPKDLISRQCCETMNSLLNHPCYHFAIKNYGVGANGEFPHLSLIERTADACGITVGKGFDHIDCGNGNRTGWERCDDGNVLPGDGCSECWIENGFSCGTMSNGMSVCRRCSENCRLAQRQICTADGETCGNCVDGYEEVMDDMGRNVCGKEYTVYYTAVDYTGLPHSVPKPSCTYRKIGSGLVEPEQYPSAQRYISYMDEHRPNRTDPGTNGTCTLKTAFSRVPRGENIAVLIELYHESVVNSVKIGESGEESLVILFSRNTNPVKVSHLNTLTHNFFDIYAGSTFVAHNLLIWRPKGLEGAVMREYGGAAILEHSQVKDFVSPPAGTLVYHEWMCDGFIFLSVSALIMRDVTISGSSLTEIDDIYCMTTRYNAITTFGYLELENVQIVNSYLLGNLFHVTSDAASACKFSKVTIYNSNIKNGGVLSSDVDIILTDLVVRKSVVGGPNPLLRLQGTTEIHDFMLSEIVSDQGSVIYNAGFTTLYDGRIHSNSYSENAAAIMNRSTLKVVNVTFSENSGGVVESTSKAYFVNCTFERNGGSRTRQFGSIYNYGVLEISNSTFNETLSADFVAVESWDPFILRDSVLPRMDTMRVAYCNTTLPASYLPRTSPCGVFSVCSDLDKSGVHCACPPSDPYGDPTVLCGALAELLVLPSPEITIYAAKELNLDGSAVLAVNQEVRLLVVGLGVVEWSVDAATLPDWLSIAPYAGYFESTSACPDNAVDALITVDLRNVTGATPILDAELWIFTRVHYVDPFVGEIGISSTVPIHVSIHVDVPASNDTSSVRVVDPPCSNNCVVEAGTEVRMRVDVRDEVGMMLGVGGNTFQIQSSDILQFQQIDFANGSYLLEFEAPQTHFSVSILIHDHNIQGSPKSFIIVCASSDEWDESAQQCTGSSLAVPKELVALCLLGTFVLAALSLRVLTVRRSLATLEVPSFVVLRKLLSCFMDVLDFGTDIGAAASVFQDESLRTYIPYYVVGLTFGAFVSAFSFGFHLSALRRVVFDARYPVRSKRSQFDERLPRPLMVAEVEGMNELVFRDDVRIYLQKLIWKLRNQLVSLVVLFLEDIPIQSLNLIILSNRTDTGFPLWVLVSTMVTMVLIGIKLTHIVGAFRTNRYISRIKRRSQAPPLRRPGKIRKNYAPGARFA
eukprot:Rmarinus@m.9217